MGKRYSGVTLHAKEVTNTGGDKGLFMIYLRQEHNEAVCIFCVALLFNDVCFSGLNNFCYCLPSSDKSHCSLAMAPLQDI